MNIANITSVNPASAPSPSQPANADRSEKSNIEPKSSTVVNISDEAKRLNEAKNAERAIAPNATSENNETKSKETSEAPGIQFMEGESKNGRVSTYA